MAVPFGTLLVACAVLTAWVGLTAPASAAAPKLPPPHAGVLSVAASPRVLHAAGGTVVVVGRVEHATSCQLQLLSGQSFPVVYSHDPSDACISGNYLAQVTIGPNTEAVQRVVAFGLVARNSTSSSEGRFYVMLDGQPAPTVLSASAAPGTLPAQGGTVSVRGKVAHASSCQLKLLSTQSFAVVYSQSPRSCTSGTFSAAVTIGANPSPVKRVVAFALLARHGNFTSDDRFDVVLASSPPASVSSVKTTPKALPARGGTVVVVGRVEHATSCQLRLLSAQSFPVVYSNSPKSCASGNFSAHVTIGANPSPISRTVSFDLIARNARSSATGTFFVPLAAPSPLTTTTTVADLDIETVTVPNGSVGAPYNFLLHASGGVPPYVWSGFAGLPPGLSVTSQGVITGTPTQGGNFFFTVTVADSDGNQSSAFLPIAISGGTTTTTTVPPPTTTTSTPGPAVQQFASENWSGYAVDGGPFTSVSGTFTVPYLTTDATCNDRESDWVGIDGWSPSGSASVSSLIQAGVSDSGVNPATGACNPSSGFYVWAWWEILPAPSSPVYSVLVNAGDSITVTISQTSGTGLWTIALTDNTDGQSFSEQEAYSGPASSAEWITEANADTACGSGLGPAPGFPGATYCTLASYSNSSGSQPGVSFDDLAYNGNVTETDQITMLQDGVFVSTPSDLDSNGLSDGFTVSYTGNEGSDLVGPLPIGQSANDPVRADLGTPRRAHGAPYVDRSINLGSQRG